MTSEPEDTEPTGPLAGPVATPDSKRVCRPGEGPVIRPEDRRHVDAKTLRLPAEETHKRVDRAAVKKLTEANVCVKTTFVNPHTCRRKERTSHITSTDAPRSLGLGTVPASSAAHLGGQHRPERASRLRPRWKGAPDLPGQEAGGPHPDRLCSAAAPARHRSEERLAHLTTLPECFSLLAAAHGPTDPGDRDWAAGRSRGHSEPRVSWHRSGSVPETRPARRPRSPSGGGAAGASATATGPEGAWLSGRRGQLHRREGRPDDPPRPRAEARTRARQARGPARGGGGSAA